MLNRFFAVLALLVLAAVPGVHAAERVSIEVWVIHIDKMKVLLAGHHHFVPVPAEIAAQRLPSGDQVLCESLAGAVSLGKRLWEGMTPHAAASAIARAHGGRAVCGTLTHPVHLQPLEVAIRSHDGVHRAYIVKAQDEFGRIHFAAKPVH
jgi:hypothetical protein